MIAKEISRDVVIVGAGAAGLAAADDLRRAGLSVAVLEARGHVGDPAAAPAASDGAPDELRRTIRALALDSVLDDDTDDEPAQVPLLLAERLGADVLLNHPVDAVTWNEQGVVADSDGLTVRARFAIVPDHTAVAGGADAVAASADVIRILTGAAGAPGAPGSPGHADGGTLAAALRRGRDAAASVIEASRAQRAARGEPDFAAGLHP